MFMTNSLKERPNSVSRYNPLFMHTNIWHHKMGIVLGGISSITGVQILDILAIGSGLNSYSFSNRFNEAFTI